MHHQSKEENSYVIDVESGAELARLMDRDVKYTEAMGSLLPPDLDGSNLHDILDIACGPGGWAMDVGFAYRHIKVIGIDISRTMIDYARALASVRRLSNVYFQVMDATQPLQFPEASFDMVNARTIIGFLSKEQWPSLVQECIRITRPGGVIRLSECDEVARTNSEAFEQMNRLVMRAFSLTGRSLSSDGENLGITSYLPRLLLQAECCTLQEQMHMIDLSAGSTGHDILTDNYLTGFTLMQSFLIKAGLTTEETWQQLLQQADIDMHMPDFRGYTYLKSVWGRKSPSG